LGKSDGDKILAKKKHFQTDNFRKNRDEKRVKIMSESIFGKSVDEKVKLDLKLSRLPDETRKMIIQPQQKPKQKINILAKKIADYQAKS